MPNVQLVIGNVKHSTPGRNARLPPAIVVVGDGTLMRPTFGAAAGVARFKKFIQWVLRDGITILTQPQLIIAAALIAEGVVSEADLIACVSALPAAVRRGDTVHASWVVKEVLHRRSLSSLTLIAGKSANSKQDTPVNWQKELDQFSETLRMFYPGSKDIAGPDRIASALNDGCAWVYLNCPMVCVAYVSGAQQLSLLSDLAHDRQCGRRELPIQGYANTEAHPLVEAMDLALDKAFDDAKPVSTSQWIIGALKKLVSVSAGENGMRAADYLVKDAVRQRLGAVVQTLARSGTPVDALLLAWVLYLLETGSLHLRNPKLSTIARYTHAAVERLHRSLNRVPVAPADLDQGEWEAFFKEVLGADDASKELRCAVASFHCFLVGEFGLDPQPWLFVGVDDVSAVSANVVWPDEITRAFNLISTFGSDLRLRQSMKVMLSIGAGNKVRIGEVRSIRLCNIHLRGEDLEIEVAPRRTHHQGKSAAARRILKYGNTEHQVAIKAWLQRRIDESAEPDDLLFGDPHQPDRGYKMGACQRILNQTLRAATGDSSVSFQTLRHTAISRDLHHTLMNAQLHHPISPITQISVEAGHSIERTTFANYFHWPEEVIRHWLDTALAPYLDSPAIAAKWLDRPADGLRQGRHRSASRAEYLPTLIGIQALALVVAPILSTTQIALVDDASSYPINAMPLTSLTRLMEDLMANHSMGGICSRNSTTEATVAHVCHAVADVVRKLKHRGLKNQPRLHKKANEQAALEFARERLRRMDFCFDVGKEDHLSALVQQLQSVAAISDKLAKAATAWTKVLADDVLSLMDPDAAKPLIELMRQGSISPDHLVMRVQSIDTDDLATNQAMLGSIKVTAARAVVEEIYETSVQIECVKSRRGRPDVYLLVSRKRTGTGKPAASASCRMNRINGLMLALAVWNQFLGGCERAAGNEA